MHLVHEKKGFVGKWEVSWTWLPYFLAADRELHKQVDKAMTEQFRGSTYEIEDPRSRSVLEYRMHTSVVDLILKKYPIPGLQQLLNCYLSIEPSQETT